MNGKTERPPIGITPSWLWEEYYPNPEVEDIDIRILSLRKAIQRYIKSGLKPPPEWYQEMDIRIKQLGDKLWEETPYGRLALAWDDFKRAVKEELKRLYSFILHFNQK